MYIECLLVCVALKEYENRMIVLLYHSAIMGSDHMFYMTCQNILFTRRSFLFHR